MFLCQTWFWDPRHSRGRERRDRGFVVMGCCLSKQSTGGVSQNVNRNASQRENAWRTTGIVGLRDARLTSLPARIFSSDVAPKCRNVDASNNKIASLPPSIGTLVNLQRLTLTSNALVTLPDELARCVNLRTLVLDRNAISHVPDSVLAALTKLQTLSLAHNKLTTMPSVSSLVKLEKLSVAGNALASLPHGVSKCASLEELDASDNPIRAIDPSLGALTRLRVLNVDGTLVNGVPPEVFIGCASLVTMSLHGCPVRADAIEETEGFAEYAARVRDKHGKKIQGGAMVGSRGLDDGVDRATAGQNIAPHR